ncbi:MAG: protein-L-isoaspartate O-methyltransferase family protein [Arachnia sp.]
MNSAVHRAFDAVPRAAFLPASLRRRTAEDRPLPLSHGQTNSQPSTVLAMLELLDVQPGHRILDVGAGSGWTTALLAYLGGPDSVVIGVERIAHLALSARVSLERTGPWPQASIRVMTPGVLGVPASAPFDRILVSAEAAHLPPALVQQLAVGGIMVIPVNTVMTKVVRTPDEVRLTHHGRYSFVPLIED